MAIRPVDLQLAYLAAPQNAAQASAAQNAPQIAQQAAQAAFAAQLEQREESIEETQGAHGATIQPDSDGGSGEGYTPQDRERKSYQTDETPLFAGDGEHFIDVVV